MATSFFFMPTDQSSVETPNELLRNTTHLVNNSGEFRTERPHKSRGRKTGWKAGQQNHKKPKLRGMGMAQLERHRIEEEKMKMVVVVAGGGDTSVAANPCTTHSLVVNDPVVVLQGFASYGGGPSLTSSVGGCTRSRLYCGGIRSGQIMIDPVCSPWGFVETPTHELSSIPNPQVYNNRCDTCFKKKRLDGEHNAIRSNGGGFSKHTMIPPPMNGYDHLLQQDERSQGFFYDHRIVRSAPVSASNNEATIHTGSMEGRSPRNGTEGVKEYEFFPGKYGSFPGKYGNTVSVATSVDDCSPNMSTIDLALKL